MGHTSLVYYLPVILVSFFVVALIFKQNKHAFNKIKPSVVVTCKADVMQPRLVESLRVRFFGRIQKRICDLRYYRFFTTKNGRPEKGSFTMTKACPRAPRGKKRNNQLIPTAKTRRKSNIKYE